eukprot:CAMPEP_0174366696 /NCGR_PEP_ID=MMETSP0811_2-20130205/82230_1 /TAXON_ID=73025 ORGANISM="Eutreptiella gymnastica-like, Strain CCMP1594" /NCGR_SAMPLE_ID=MMETSP0811_2 /ASSEMBLY_ACC=CAM_ASM_000667 /LENGTH=71 /DNA_ID=CAMNT_0015508513 /DNA_START=862 /DNA_END=1077 /DNA_ORIENTATION=-
MTSLSEMTWMSNGLTCHSPENSWHFCCSPKASSELSDTLLNPRCAGNIVKASVWHQFSAAFQPFISGVHTG